MIDAVTGQSIAITTRSSMSDSSGGHVWRRADGRMFASSGPWSDSSIELVFAGSMSPSDRPFREFSYGVLVVDIGYSKYRVLRFDLSVHGSD